MTILTPTMQLEKPESGDLMEPYFLGVSPSGGYWTILTRLSEHDHTGGVNGAPLTAATIPDGSITPSKLAPSVYTPLALVDGSHPFTGTQEFQADLVVRDEVQFGPAGSAAAPDAFLARTGTGGLRLRQTLELDGAGSLLQLNDRTAAGRWFRVVADANALTVSRPEGPRLAVNATGTLTVTPDAGAAALTLTGAPYVTSLIPVAGTSELQVFIAGYGGYLGTSQTAVRPLVDGTPTLGDPTHKWNQIYSSFGTISTSAAAAKQDVAPLDPAAALAAVLATDPVTFTYTAPAAGADRYDLPDDPELAERVLYERLVNEPLAAAARTQAGFVLADPTGRYQTDPLFETGAGQSSATNSIGVLLAALHEVNRRLTAGGL